jgi:hypothetical protein
MIGNKDEVLQAIKKLANDNGYDFFPGECRLRKDMRGETIGEVLCLAVQPREGDNRELLNFVVTNGENRFMVTFAGEDVPMYCKDLNQLLIIIKDWVIKQKRLSRREIL